MKTALLCICLLVSVATGQTTRPATQPVTYPALQRRLAQLVEEVEVLRAENKQLKEELWLMTSNLRASTRPAVKGDGSSLKNGMTRDEAVQAVGRDPDRETSASDGSTVLVWTITGPEKDPPGGGGYVGVQLSSKEGVYGLRNAPPRQVPVGQVQVTLQNDKVVQFQTSKF